MRDLQLPAAGDAPIIRCHAVSFGPVKWRFFWARIDNGLYVASKKFILDDLVVAHVARRKPRPDALPEDLDVSAYVGPYVFPNHNRRKVPAYLYLGFSVLCVAIWLLGRASGVCV